jgi:transmembrane sensor
MAHTENVNILSGSVQDSLEHKKGLSDSDKIQEAVLLVKEIESVDVDHALNKVRNKINDKNKIYRLITVITRVAAVLTLPLLFFSIWHLTASNNTLKLAENSISWQEIQSPVGIRSEVLLPDGTNLWLNAGSKIRYGIPFVRENRQIELTGEAFLHVAKNDKVPFVVNTADVEIKVLGTQFNVKAYPEEKHIEVALKEGSVEFSSLNSEYKKVSTELIPRDYLTFNKEDYKTTIENVDIEKYISWYQNYLIFEDTPMTEWATIIERWYGVKIEFLDEEIGKFHFNGTIKDETMQDVMQILEMTLDISYSIDYKNISIRKSRTNN